jgi:trigger factor
VEVSISTHSEVQQEAEILVTNEELQPHFKQAYEKYRPKVELKGFRKGKAPMEMIKKLYGEAIEQDSLDTVASEFYRIAMKERNIHPIGQPSLTDMDFKRGEHFRFKIKYEVRPAIELKQYKGVAVEKPIHIVTDAEIQKEIERIRHVNSTTIEATTVTDNEHIVSGDVQELDATGTPLIGKKTPNARFYLADETLPVEVRETLAHAELNRVYPVTFESKHDDHTHSTHLAITVTKIEKVNLPPFDDTFVKKVTGDKVNTTEEFLKNLRVDLTSYWKEKGDRALSDAIAEELVRMHEFPVPVSLVNSFLDAFVEDIKSRSKDKKLPRDFNEEKFRDDSRAFATWQAKWMLLKERIAEAEDIKVTDAELEAKAAAEAEQIGIGKERLLEYYRNSGSTVDRLLSERIISFLKENATITEKLVSDERG